MTVIIINPLTGNGDGQPLEWLEWVVDFVTGRYDLENFGILKRQLVEARPLKRAVGFFGLIKADQFGSRPAEISWDLRHHKMCCGCVCVWGGVSIVWLAHDFLIRVSFLPSPKTEAKKINSFVPPVFVPLLMYIHTLRVYNNSSEIHLLELVWKLPRTKTTMMILHRDVRFQVFLSKKSFKLLYLTNTLTQTCMIHSSQNRLENNISKRVTSPSPEL